MGWEVRGEPQSVLVAVSRSKSVPSYGHVAAFPIHPSRELQTGPTGTVRTVVVPPTQRKLLQKAVLSQRAPGYENWSTVGLSIAVRGSLLADRRRRGATEALSLVSMRSGASNSSGNGEVRKSRRPARIG